MIFLVAFGGLSSWLCAQPSADTLTLQKELRELKVDGSKQRVLRSAMPSQLITSHQIENLNVANVADIAKHFAGVSIKDYGGIGGLKTISVRGLGAQHSAVSYDGLVMSDIQSGQIDLSQFCIENISTVSLDNGQPMQLLQSARAFSSSSLLTLKTKQPVYNPQHSFSGNVGIKTGSFGLINPTLQLEQFITSRFAISLNANVQRATGNYPYAININPYGENWVNGVRRNTDVSTAVSELNSVVFLKENETLTAKISNYFCERGIPGAVTVYNNSVNTERLKDFNWLGQLQYENKSHPIWQYLVATKYNSQSLHYSETSVNHSSLLNNTRVGNYLQNEYYISSTVQNRAIPNVTLAAAIDSWYNNLFTYSNMNFSKDALPVRITSLGNVSAKYVNERLTLGGNLLCTATHETADSTFAAPDRRKLSPTAYFSWQIGETDNLMFRAFYKEIFRLPTFTELYYHDLGFKFLLPENTQQFNVGLTYYTNKLKLFNYVSITADAYFNRITDKITIVYGMPFSSVRNIGLVEVKGSDFQMYALKNLNNSSSIEINANYTFQLAQNKELGSEVYNDIIPYTPVHSGSVSLSYRYKKIQTGYNMLLSGKRYAGQNADIFNYLKPYADQSLFASIDINKLKIRAEMLNLANTNYAIVSYYPMPGRYFRCSIDYQF